MGSFKDLATDTLENADNAQDQVNIAVTSDSEGGSRDQPAHNTAITIPLDAISTDFNNTRRKVNQTDVDGLKCSIQQIGLISAITVRPLPDRQYQLVSGFNRVEAVRQLGFQSVNAIVLKDADEAHALEANIAENMVRKGLSLGEQSSAIKRLFTTLEGDEDNKIDQISIRLNLSKKAVKDRLVLTALNEQGLAAFDDGKISLKSAIVLAGLTEQKQGEYLEKLTTGALTHEGLLEEVGKATIPLSLAKFDLTDCQQCPSNSELQGSLFAEPNAQSCAANCQNPTCFKEKSKAWYDNRVVELEQEYGTIIPVSQADRGEINPITVDALGETQLSQCQGCVNNVTLVQNKVGQTFGDVINNICNNKSCFSQCANTHAESLKEAQAPQVNTQQGETVVADDSTPPTKAAAKPSTPKVPTSAGALSKAAREQARHDLAAVQLAKALNDPRDSAMLGF